MLCDTGPLVALLDADDPNHQSAHDVLDTLPAALAWTTTWPCITEAMYLLFRAGGHAEQEKLWEVLDRGSTIVFELPRRQWPRHRALMAKYADAPMDFADGSLVTAAEVMGDRKIFTFDQHFRTYLIHDQFPFEVIP